MRMQSFTTVTFDIPGHMPVSFVTNLPKPTVYVEALKIGRIARGEGAITANPGRLIAAIKHARAKFGLDLKTSKQFAEYCRDTITE